MIKSRWMSLVDKADFRTLFIDELGWSNPDQGPMSMDVEGRTYWLTQVAGYKGLRIWYCNEVPARKVQRIIDQAIGLDSHERLVIFADASHQQWRWPRRAHLGSTNTKLVLHEHNVGVEDKRLIDQLGAIAIDFEAAITLVELLDRMRGAFNVEAESVSAQAARLMGTLYSELETTNWKQSEATLLLARLLFLFFGDDSGMWRARMFHGFLVNNTSPGGLAAELKELFKILNTDEAERQLPPESPYAEFRYVNGGLFDDELDFKALSSAFRDELILASEFDWAVISPAVFGSMFQTVKDKEARRHGGEHYTTEENILKTIEPLFLDEFRQRLKNSWDDKGQLTRLHNDLGRVRVLDPACGCGNFLIVAYRELRAIELDLLLRQRELEADNKNRIHAQLSLDVTGDIKVTLDHFFGIEIDEWPARIAETAMLLVDHLANQRMAEDFGIAPDRLPIQIAPKIVLGSALALDWNDVVPATELSYIVGNPPFNGSRTMTASQKAELRLVADGIREAGFLDYVAGWYLLASRMMVKNSRIKCGLVSTNSISQGEQPAILWRPLYRAGIHIDFAHQTFVWENESTGNAAVHCVIIGFSAHDAKPKRLFSYVGGRGEPIEAIVDKISPYLLEGDEYVVGNRQSQLSGRAEMAFGNMAADDGNLIMTLSEKDELLAEWPIATKWVKPFLGAREFINAVPRYCLWLEGVALEEIRLVPPVWSRVEATRSIRESSSRPQLARIPQLFAQITQRPTDPFLLIPSASSERRRYVPMGFYEAGVVASNLCLVIARATLDDFAILTSTMHMDWLRTVGGRLKSDYRYSKDVVYNNFVFPSTSTLQKETLRLLASQVLSARSESPNRSLAWLYDDASMPGGLRKAHADLDEYVDLLYKTTGFADAADRVRHLFQLHRDVESGLLAAVPSRSRQRRGPS